jgi:spore maturation protein CgeB
VNGVPRVLVCTSFPDHINVNPGIRHGLARGFAELLGEAAVVETGFDAALPAMQSGVPDLVVAVGSCLPPDSDYLGWRRHCDRHACRLIFWLTDDPYEFDPDWKIMRIADHVFTNDANAALHHDSPHVSHLPLAASPAVHWRAVTDATDCDVFFCGVAFENRKRLLRAVLPALSDFQVELMGDWWPKNMAVARNIRLTPGEICDRYNRARLTLNIGRSLDIANDRLALAASTPGPRTFEAAMAGAVQAYHAEDLEIVEYFEPGREILLFDTGSELARLVEAMRDDPAHRRATAMASQQRCLAEHTYACRARRILEAGGYSPFHASDQPPG